MWSKVSCLKFNLHVPINQADLAQVQLTKKISEREKIGPIYKKLWQCYSFFLIRLILSPAIPANRKINRLLSRVVACKLANKIEPTKIGRKIGSTTHT